MNSKPTSERTKNSYLHKLTMLALVAPLVVSCTGEVTDVGEEDQEKLSVAAAGRWVIPSDIADLGDDQDVSYTGAGPWVGTSSCSGGMLAGTAIFKDYLDDSFPQISLIGGYSCRRIVGSSSRMSVHGTGRALDIHIPTINGAADNEAGDEIANWLIANSEEIGVQYIIWDRTQWTAARADGTKGRRYNGAHPHHDHLHIELSTTGGAANTPWFDGPMGPPSSPFCDSIPAAGTTIDNDSLCLRLNGPSRYWRSVDGEGHGGDLVWTNAFRSSNPSNWAQWELPLAEAGLYEVEVYLDPDHAEFAATEYRVRADGTSTSVEVDQSSADGWHSLGEFDFASGGGQHVSVLDNVSTSPTGARAIAVDALRITPVSLPPSP